MNSVASIWVLSLSGFIGGIISCPEQSALFFIFDEVLIDGDVNPDKQPGSVNNLITYELEPGLYGKVWVWG
jgi:hypothetical protein